ncbi:MAG: 4Fe-4S binding protein [Methanococci archaeon]|nr:4Fe-4S binding protein [Methanococci archaeon]
MNPNSNNAKTAEKSMKVGIKSVVRSYLFLLIKWTFFFLVVPGIFVSILFCPYVIPFIYCDVCPVYFCPMKIFRIPFLIVAFFYVLLSKKRFYTICPAGTLQDVIISINKKTLNRIKLLNVVQRNMLKVVRYMFLALALILVLIFNDPRYIDPYHTFSIEGLMYENIFYYIRVAIILSIFIFAFFIPRFWCKICPFGALISLIYLIYDKIHGFIRRLRST